MYVFLALAALCCLLGLLSHWIKSARWRHLPGYSWALSAPVVGHAYLGLVSGITDPIKHIERCRRRFGDLFRCDIGHDPTVILCDYDDIVASSRTEGLLGKPYDNLFPFVDVRGERMVEAKMSRTKADHKVWSFFQLQERIRMESWPGFSSARAARGRTSASSPSAS